MSSYKEDPAPISPIDTARMLKLVDEGGWMVSSNRCGPMELAWARAEGRFFVSNDGLGYVVRPSASFPAEQPSCAACAAGVCSAHQPAAETGGKDE